MAPRPPALPKPPPGVTGTYHRVEKGQTLWRISKMYGAELQDVVDINKITDASSIEVGQMIFIPRGQAAPPTRLEEETHAQPSYPRAVPVADEDFIWPLRGRVISTFGQVRDNVVSRGLNIQPAGDGAVKASRSGTVAFLADNLEGYGATIIIDHGDGFSTVYSRNAEMFVKPGDTVKQGTVIAKAGAAGRDRERYLHFEIRKGYTPQNPYFYLSR